MQPPAAAHVPRRKRAAWRMRPGARAATSSPHQLVQESKWMGPVQCYLRADLRESYEYVSMCVYVRLCQSTEGP